MAKVSGMMKISGLVDGKVHVQGKHGYHLRNAPQSTGEKSAAFTRQKERTGYLNAMASEINKLIPIYSENFGRKTFYNRLKKAFRREELDRHFFMLCQLAGMDINPKYSFEKHGEVDFHVTIQGKDLKVELEVLKASLYRAYKADSYYYQVSLFCWNKENVLTKHQRQLTDWILFTETLPTFEFLFPQPEAPDHWLLCVRVILGHMGKRLESFFGEGMEISGVGTFNKEDMAILEERSKIPRKSKKADWREELSGEVRVGRKK